MGQYTNMYVNTHLKKDKLEEIGYLLSGLNGDFYAPNKYDDTSGCFNCLSGSLIDYDINEQDEIVLHDFAKWTSYADAAAFKFGTFATMERLAKYLGGCDVLISTEEGIAPHPQAVNGKYEYTTPVKENVLLDKEVLIQKVKEYAPCLIHLELFNSQKDERNRDKLMPSEKASSIIYRNFKNVIKTPIQLANVTAFLCYTNKESLEFTKEDVEKYLKKDNSAWIGFHTAMSNFFGGNLSNNINVCVTSRMRCQGMEEFFKEIGREDLAKVVKSKAEFLDKKSECLKKLMTMKRC